MRKSTKVFLFIFIESLMLITIVFLILKISNLYNNARGIQYVTDISKDIIFDKENQNLKYFYEPEANKEEIDAPSWLGYTVINWINADTLNEPYDFPIQKPNNSYRIITLGDSFTFGHHVRTEENYPEVLEKMLNKSLRCSKINKFEVINLGVSGYDIEYSVERFIKRGIKYTPDLVIWFLNNWNFELVNEFFLPLQQKIKDKGVPSFNINTKRYEAYIEALAQLNNSLGEKSIFNYQKNALSRLENYKGIFLVAGFPLERKYEKLINDFVSNNFTFHYEQLPNKSNAADKLPDGHLNKDGYKKIAESIMEVLLKHYLIGCKKIKSD